jgi:hypothetical protein
MQDIFQQRPSWSQMALSLAKSSDHADMTVDAVPGNKTQQFYGTNCVCFFDNTLKYYFLGKRVCSSQK